MNIKAIMINNTKPKIRIGIISEELTIENIAKARNLLVLGGEVDINRCAAMILSDFRHGKVGRVTLDTLFLKD